LSDPHHHHEGGGDRARQDVARWDERYAATDRLWSAEPNATVAEVVASIPPGRALDLGTGEGRHAVWLARRGWSVTAVDFSAVGVDRGRAESDGLAIDWVVADLREWEPPAGATFDLVLAAYLHLADDVFARVRTWLAPGGSLVVLGHALRNLTEGVGGPQDPRLLHTEEQLRTAATGLEIDQLREVLRPTEAGVAIDLLLVARRTPRAG
jgi:SAM-dependent methyltransferase